MLSHLDFIIFPDRCEVIELPSQRYFYPIFKNASSSIFEQAKLSNWKIYLNEQVKKLPHVDAIIRPPQERFISGINSFVSQTLKINPTLDKKTVCWFAKNYLHLNRHYCMQFSWLVNLARYLDKNTKISLVSPDYVTKITNIKWDPWGVKDQEFSSELTSLPMQEMYSRIDQVLFNAIGNSLTFTEILELVKKEDPDAFKQVILRSQQILNPTYVVPKA